MKTPDVGSRRRVVWVRWARSTRKWNTWLWTTYAAAVATNQPTDEMISVLRSASRCSMTDIRVSSTCRGGRRLVRRAMARRLGRLLGVALGLDGRDRGDGSRLLGCCLLLGCRLPLGFLLRLLLGHRVLQLVGDLVGRLPELADREAGGATELGQLARSEDDEHDDEKDDKEGRVDVKWHSSPVTSLRLYARRLRSPDLDLQDPVGLVELAGDVEADRDRREVVVDVGGVTPRPGIPEDEELGAADAAVGQASHPQRARHPLVVRARRLGRQGVAGAAVAVVPRIAGLDDPGLGVEELQSVEVPVGREHDEVVDGLRRRAGQEHERDGPLGGDHGPAVVLVRIDAHRRG